LFRRWAGISAIAGALQQKVWSYTSDFIYPNLYVVLVGPSGVGKTRAIKPVAKMWREIDALSVSPNSLTKASLIDSLAECRRDIVNHARTPPLTQFNSLLCPITELDVLLKSYDTEFMSVLTDIYDVVPYEERRRGKDLHIKIDRPQLNILGGTTPAALFRFMPDEGWEMGFASRTILIFSEEASQQPIFSGNIQGSERLYERLLHDLKLISADAFFGQMVWDSKAIDRLEDWKRSGSRPEPTHPKLVSYNSRRVAHLLKLSMIASVSRGSDFKITEGDYEVALGWLIEAEMYMEDIFVAKTSGGDTKHIDDCVHFIIGLWRKDQRPVPEQRVQRFLGQKVLSIHIRFVIDAMIASGRVQVRPDPKNPEYRLFLPKLNGKA